MIVQQIKQIAEGLGYTFNYGVGAWQNLVDHEDDSDLPVSERQIHVKLWYVDREKNFNEFGSEVSEKNYSGMFMIGVRSRIDDEDYSYKFENHIFPLLAEAADKICVGLDFCDGWSWKSWRMKEFHNELDTNMDGWKVEFTAKNG